MYRQSFPNNTNNYSNTKCIVFYAHNNSSQDFNIMLDSKCYYSDVDNMVENDAAAMCDIIEKCDVHQNGTRLLVNNMHPLIVVR